MLRIFLLLILSQIAKSSNGTLFSNSTVNKSTNTTLQESSNLSQGNVPNFTLANRHNIVVGESKVEPADCSRFKVTFKVRNEVQHLNGHFEVFHGGRHCGSVRQPTPLSNPQDVIIYLDSKISPCNSYDRFEIRTHFTDGRPPKPDNTGPWKAKAFRNCCPHLTTTITITTSTTTTSIATTALTITSNESSSTADSSPAPVSEAQIDKAATAGIVVGVVLPILVVTALVTILFKRKRDENNRRDEEMPVDANPVYGIYDDGALYNVVEDGNDYYES